MPRHTHLRPRAKHDRAHVRHHRERKIAGRWSQLKQHYQYLDTNAEEISKAALMDRMVSWTWVRADGKQLDMPSMWGYKRERIDSPWSGTWPFDQPKNKLAVDSPLRGRRCRCAYCNQHRSRAVRERAWQKEDWG